MRLCPPAALLAAALIAAAPAAYGQQPDPEAPPGLPPAETGAGAVVRGPAALPASPVLTINEAALFGGAAWGKRVQAELERRSRELAAENDRSYDELAAREDELTALRATLPPEEFRQRAEAFDSHAEAVRAERQAALRALNDFAEAERQDFFSQAIPVFADIMAERGAAVILDQRMVFVSADAVDVTQTLIERIDAHIGPGPLPGGAAENALKAAPAPTPQPAPEAD